MKFVRVLFDTGSNKSFITAEADSKIGLCPVRKEKLSVMTFGSTDAEVKTRDGRNLFSSDQW